MAIHTVVTLGYSVSGGFQGGTATLPTLGYDSGDVVVPTSEGLQARAPGRPLHAKTPGEPLHARVEEE